MRLTHSTAHNAARPPCAHAAPSCCPSMLQAPLLSRISSASTSTLLSSASLLSAAPPLISSTDSWDHRRHRLSPHTPLIEALGLPIHLQSLQSSMCVRTQILHSSSGFPIYLPALSPGLSAHRQPLDTSSRAYPFPHAKTVAENCAEHAQDLAWQPSAADCATRPT